MGSIPDPSSKDSSGFINTGLGSAPPFLFLLGSVGSRVPARTAGENGDGALSMPVSALPQQLQGGGAAGMRLGGLLVAA